MQEANSLQIMKRRGRWIVVLLDSGGPAVRSARSSLNALLNRDARRAGAIFMAAALLVSGAVELAIAFRAQGSGPHLPGSPRLDYAGMAHAFAPLEARFIESVLGGGSEFLAGGTEVPTTRVSGGNGGTPVIAMGPPSSQENERVVDTHALTNDDRSDARVIPGIPFTARTNDSGATRDSSDPDDCSSIGGTVWYRFTPEKSVGVVAFTYGTDHSMALGVFREADGLTTLGCDTDPRGNALFAFPAKKGRAYLFQLTAPVQRGALVLHLEAHGGFELISRARGGAVANNDSGTASMSADGRYVAFKSWATNLVPGVDDRPCSARNPMYAEHEQSPCPQIYVRDVRTNRTEIVSLSPRGDDGDGESSHPFISANGRYVAFESAALNVSGKDHPVFLDIFVHDRLTNRTEWIATSGRDGFFGRPSLSDAGRFVAFVSSEPLVRRDKNGDKDVYVFDRRKDDYELVSVSSSERVSEYTRPRAEPEPCVGGIAPGGIYPDLNPYMSGDGRWVVFRSDATNLVPDDDNGDWDTFVRDRTNGRTERVSISSSGVEANGSSYYNYLAHSQISADGRYVVFSSCASNLTTDDKDDLLDAFLHNRSTGRTTLLSGGLGLGEISGWASISRDGRFVTFDSEPFNFPDEPEYSDVYRHDTLTGVTSFVTLTPFGTDSSGWMSTISADGKAVLFLSSDPRLGRTEGLENIFLYRVPKTL